MKLHKLLLCMLGCTLLMQAVPANAQESVSTPSGEGMCIAVLDTGFVTSHESFVISNGNPKLTESECTALLNKTNAGRDGAYETLFVSEKIPFAYDYGDGDNDVSGGKYTEHGTAMISVCAGSDALLENPNPAARGTAPEAQILAMKVYSDKTDRITEDAMCAAIEDAVILGADAIFIGIYEPCGFSESPDRARLTKAIEKADSLGIAVIAPTGDIITYGNDSIYYHSYEMSTVSTDMPDTGTTAWPASIDGVFAVGSSDSNTVTSDSFTLSDGRRIPYGDSTQFYKSAGDGKSFAQLFHGKTLAYTVIDGVGTDEDFAASESVAGKLAVVERGTISFNEKAKNAAKAGAVGVIVIDNQPDRNAALITRMDISESTVPAIIISAASGKLMESSPNKEITVSMDSVYTSTTRITKSPSSFSAGGTTPELLLKPDITAVGRSVSCALPDGGYGTINSTAASAAGVSGMYVCVKAEAMLRFPDLQGTGLMNRVKAMLSGSAQLMLQGENGVPYSPRVQGGGSADTVRALNNPILLTSNGSSKIQVKNNIGQIVQLSVTAENISDTDRTCTLSAIVGSDGFSAYTYEELDIENTDDPLYKRLGKSPSDTLSFIEPFIPFGKTSVMPASHLYRLNRFSDEYSPYTFTLAPGESETFELTVYLDGETYKSYKETFKNGFFIEGFVIAESGDSISSIPFCAFSGNYSSAPHIDSDLYGDTPAIYDGIYLYRAINDRTVTVSNRIVLGSNSFGEMKSSSVYERDMLAFSPVVDKNTCTVMLNFGLLRGVSDVSVKVSAPDGRILENTYYGSLHRTYISDQNGMLTSVQLPLFTGRAADNPSYIYPDGIYTVNIEWRIPGTQRTGSISYDIRLDTRAPELKSHVFSKNADGTVYLKLDTADDHRVHTVNVVDGNGGTAVCVDEGIFDVTDLSGEHIYVDIFDCAANSVTVRLKNQERTSDED